MISIKSNGARIIFNTFLDNHGQLVVRAGNNILIEGNQFIASQVNRKTGGIRVHGTDISILNNFFQDIPGSIVETGKGHQRLFDVKTVGAGSGSEEIEKGYRQAFNITLAGNLVVDASTLEDVTKVSEPRVAIFDTAVTLSPANPGTLPPENWQIQGNVFVTSRPLITGVDRLNFHLKNNNICNSNENYQNRNIPSGTTPQQLQPYVIWQNNIFRLMEDLRGSRCSVTESNSKSENGHFVPDQLSTPLAPADIGPDVKYLDTRNC